MEKTFDILGFSGNMVSMISDVLAKADTGEVKIRIIKNMVSSDNTPFKISSIDYMELSHTEWEKPSENILMGVYKVNSKKAVYEFFKSKYSIDFSNYSNLVHPFTDVALSVNTGKGFFCNPGVTIGPYATIGNLVTVNRLAIIGHHVNISDFCVISPGANIAGFCHLSEGVTIGMGAILLNNIHVGDNSIIGAGSLVTKDIPANVVAYGNPAKVIRENE